jgi:hypothetical protein
MIYLLLFIAATLILLYVTSRWLRGELRELRAWLGEKLVLQRGGESQSNVIAGTQRAFEAEGLHLDFMIVSRQVLPCYAQLRRRHIDRTPADPLPVAVVLALAADTNARRLCLRAVVPQAGAPARDRTEFIDFDEIVSVQTVDRTTPDGVAPGTDQALELTFGDDRPPHHLNLEDWSVSPSEIVLRVRGLLAGDWRPEAPPTIVR